MLQFRNYRGAPSGGLRTIPEQRERRQQRPGTDPIFVAGRYKNGTVPFGAGPRQWPVVGGRWPELVPTSLREGPSQGPRPKTEGPRPKTARIRFRAVPTLPEEAAPLVGRVKRIIVLGRQFNCRPNVGCVSSLLALSADVSPGAWRRHAAGDGGCLARYQGANPARTEMRTGRSGFPKRSIAGRSPWEISPRSPRAQTERGPTTDRGGQSHFRGGRVARMRNITHAAKIGTVPLPVGQQETANCQTAARPSPGFEPICQRHWS